MNIADLSLPQQSKMYWKVGNCQIVSSSRGYIKAGALEGQNIVLASPTASGKTLIAELLP
jgi:replicative superfamily II helicase